MDRVRTVEDIWCIPSMNDYDTQIQYRKDVFIKCNQEFKRKMLIMFNASDVK